MTEHVRTQVLQDATFVKEITGTTSPLPAESDPQPIEDPRVAEIARSIVITDTSAIVSFGAGAQSELQQISQGMLEDVRNKDTGEAGEALREIVTSIRGFPIKDMAQNKDLPWWRRFFAKNGGAIARMIAKYETVQSQIDMIAENLLGHQQKLLKDIRNLDQLYDSTLDFYKELAVYIAAGEAALERLETVTIPEAEAALETAPEEGKTLAAQGLRDIRQGRDDLERRVHDLRLTRQVTMQSLPSIRMVQENDKSLVTKISSTLQNTIPLWETQLAQALTVERSKQAAEAVRDASDLTNELLTANAENLRETNKIVRQEMERGIVDIEAVQAANDNLIATIEDSLQIAEEGKRSRREAEEQLETMTVELRTKLAQASSPQKAA